MEYRRLGKSGLMVSTVGLGTNNFGMRIDEKASAAVVNAAIEQGINLLDTANMYGGTKSEEYIGKALKGKRGQVLLATKAGGRMGEGPNERGASRKHLMEELEKSLKRLQTEYVDLYQIHFPDPETPIEETLRALDDMVHQGKVRYIGCSNYTAWQVCEAVWTSKAMSLEPFVSVQPHYNLLNRGIERELLPFCQAYGIGVIPYFPLASGLLTGKYRAGQPAPEGTRLAGPAGQRTLTDENLEAAGRLEEHASARGHTLLELAFGWLLAKPQVATVIAGATKPDQVESNVKAAEGWRLSDEEVREADDLTGQFLRR